MQVRHQNAQVIWQPCITFQVLNWLLPSSKTFLVPESACTQAVTALVWVVHFSYWINHFKNMKKSTQSFIIVIENFILCYDHREYNYIEVTLVLQNELEWFSHDWVVLLPWRHSPQVLKNIRISRDFSFVSEEFVVFSFWSVWKIFPVSLINFRSKHPLLSFNLFCDSEISAWLTLQWIILTRRPTSSEPLHFLFFFFLIFFNSLLVIINGKVIGWLMVVLIILENSQMPILIFYALEVTVSVLIQCRRR